jgi:hypothetical protein
LVHEKGKTSGAYLLWGMLKLRKFALMNTSKLLAMVWAAAEIEME